ncbi:methyltransferase type 11 [Natronococcus pandeyae]|uniref:Methyltransferase type 11 n=1 Tax=Natronococcus pandeyae TaxID=2055836 RepID=A0A8J8PYR9_9EURY|nr:class I SAM-dependent methyltransferase [Natronococcus pandeyae]TYL36920.1 methyltransferase type 11 [Natronococcus pandeyae]
MEPDSQSARVPSEAPPDVPNDRRYAAHLERNRRVWDRWSDWYGMSERDFEPIREATIDRLELEEGDRVLDVGCGPGVNFEHIRHKIGTEGRLAGVDYSPGMVENARERVDRHGWANVEVRRADATTVDFDERFDAAVATLSLGVMPDARRTLENVRRLLVPGGPLALVDVRPAPSGPVRLLNPVIWRFFRWYANWNPDNDVLESGRAVFEECELVETAVAGTAYAAVCRTAGPRDAE